MTNKFITKCELSMFETLGFEPIEAQALKKQADILIKERIEREALARWVDSLPTAVVNFHHDLEDGWYSVSLPDGTRKEYNFWFDLRAMLVENRLNPVWLGSNPSYMPDDLHSIYEKILDVPKPDNSALADWISSLPVAKVTYRQDPEENIGWGWYVVVMPDGKREHYNYWRDLREDLIKKRLNAEWVGNSTFYLPIDFYTLYTEILT